MANNNEIMHDHPGERTLLRMQGQEGQRTEYREEQTSNCSELFQSGSHGGDPKWNPADGNWWTYPGIGGSAGNYSAGSIMAAAPNNPSGYDFVGGQTTSNTPLPEVGVNASYSGYSTVVNRPHVQIQKRTFNNCNCGQNGSGTVYNCYSNCNCNCACACACDCQCCDA